MEGRSNKGPAFELRKHSFELIELNGEEREYPRLTWNDSIACDLIHHLPTRLLTSVALHMCSPDSVAEINERYTLISQKHHQLIEIPKYYRLGTPIHEKN